MENLLSYTALPDVDTFHYTILENCLLILSPTSLEKSSCIKSCGANSGEHKFSKVLNFT